MPQFSGNVNLLIAAPMLQDLLVDKDGTPMAAGTITCYHDNNRSLLKNWYYQTGAPGNYTYTALPNPLTLSAAGTICDINGVDTIPFFYPYSEVNEETRDPYYITIVNHAQTNQITRANFPFVPPGGNAPNLINSYTNLICNSGFWRNVQPNTVLTSATSVNLNDIIAQNYQPDSNLYYALVAPGAHDGLKFNDIQFAKSNKTATDTLTFVPFPLSDSQPVTNAATNAPEYYISHTASGATSAGETAKYYQIPIATHLNSLANMPFTFSILAQNGSTGGGTGSNVITVQLLQFTGSGTTSPTPTTILTISANTNWNQYTFSGTIPGTSGLSLGTGADDGLYLLINLPINTNFTLNFTKPSFYLTDNTIPSYDYQTYDSVNSIISSPRTGDIRISVNPFFNPGNQWVYGWVPMNDGTIGNASSHASTRANADTWLLFNLLWTFAKPYDSGSNFNPICTLFNSLGSATNYGSSAISDFNANNSLALTRLMGQVMLGTVPVSAILGVTSSALSYKSVVNDASSGGLLFTSTSPFALNLFTGNTVTFQNVGGALNTAIVANAVYYVITTANPMQFYIALSFANAMAGAKIASGTLGTGTTTAYIQLTGSSEGEYGHFQLENQLASHFHQGSQTTFNLVSTNSGGGGAVTTVNPASPTSSLLAIAPDPAAIDQVRFNVTQPGTFYNMFIKL